MNIPFKILNISAILVLLFSGCQPEMPVTSSITIDLEGFSVPVNQKLYGVTIEEINHAIDGGLYAEMIQNRSFEEEALLNCPYDAKRNVLSTPNGWTIPFIRPDSVPGWRKISSNTSIWPDGQELINDKNKRSLLVLSRPLQRQEEEVLLLPVIMDSPYAKEKNMNCLYF